LKYAHELDELLQKILGFVYLCARQHRKRHQDGYRLSGYSVRVWLKLLRSRQMCTSAAANEGTQGMCRYVDESKRRDCSR
jgi:hypothetical protein